MARAFKKGDLVRYVRKTTREHRACQKDGIWLYDHRPPSVERYVTVGYGTRGLIVDAESCVVLIPLLGVTVRTSWFDRQRWRRVEVEDDE